MHLLFLFAMSFIVIYFSWIMKFACNISGFIIKSMTASTMCAFYLFFIYSFYYHFCTYVLEGDHLLWKGVFVGFEGVYLSCCFSFEAERMLGCLYKGPEPFHFPLCFMRFLEKKKEVPSRVMQPVCAKAPKVLNLLSVVFSESFYCEYLFCIPMLCKGVPCFLWSSPFLFGISFVFSQFPPFWLYFLFRGWAFSFVASVLELIGHSCEVRGILDEFSVALGQE